MKKNLLLISALLSMLFVGCQTDMIDSTIDGDGSITLTVSTAVTRTSLGEKTGDVYPVYWSEGDKISVNGVQSEEAVINVADASKAQFTINSSVNYPQHIRTSAHYPMRKFPQRSSAVQEKQLAEL